MDRRHSGDDGFRRDLGPFVGDAMTEGIELCGRCGASYIPDKVIHSCCAVEIRDGAPRPVGDPGAVSSSNSQAVLIAEIVEMRAALAGAKAEAAKYRGRYEAEQRNRAELLGCIKKLVTFDGRQMILNGDIAALNDARRLIAAGD
jgi:hypothetical protein